MVVAKEKTSGRASVINIASNRVRPRVVVVGAGFAGLKAVKVLAGTEVEVLLLDKNNYHGFWPLLYQVASAGLEPESIAYPIRGIIQPYKNVSFQLAEVTQINFEAHQIYLKEGEPIWYDLLIVAAGSIPNYFGNYALAEQTVSLKNLTDAIELRNRILSAFERAIAEKDPVRRVALMSVVVVGGGPTGVELAGAFAELFRHVIPKDYPMLDMSEAHIYLVEADSNLLLAFPEKLRESAKRQLAKMGVEIRLNSVLEVVNPGEIIFKDGTILAAETVVWSAGARGAELAERLGLSVERGARVPVEKELHLPGRPEVFVIGDMAYLEGYKGKSNPYPMVAPVALQQGNHAARNILAQVRGKPQRPFKYFDRGTVATIGRRAAVFDAFGIKISGFLAWVVWLCTHLLFLIGFRKRLLIIINWAYNYFTYDRAARLIRK